MSFMVKKRCSQGELWLLSRSCNLLTLFRLIIDDNYEHVLRVFKDRDSGAIRLQASVRSGELKR